MSDTDCEKFRRAIEMIDAANAQDPNVTVVDGAEHPKELVYGQRMSQRLVLFAPDASEPLRIAARAQHIKRWTHPRDAYPMDRKGYHLWRTELYSYHADETEAIMRDVGYDDDAVDTMRELMLKKRIKKEADAQTLEDVICLVFLEHEFDAFAAKHEDEKVVTILQRTWKKMSAPGQSAALELPLSDEAKRLVGLALGPGPR